MGNGKVWIRKGGYRDFSSEFFCFTAPKNFVGEFLNVALITGAEKVWIRRGSIKIFLGKFFSFTVPKSFVGSPFSVSLISGIEKIYASMGYVTNFDFLSKVFCLTVPKIFAGEPFSAVFQEISGSAKSLWIRGGWEYQVFPSETFCLRVPKTFVGESFTLALISGTEKVWIRGGGVSSFSVENSLFHSAEKLLRGIL